MKNVRRFVRKEPMEFQAVARALVATVMASGGSVWVPVEVWDEADRRLREGQSHMDFTPMVDPESGRPGMMLIDKGEEQP